MAQFSLTLQKYCTIQ